MADERGAAPRPSPAVARFILLGRLWLAGLAIVLVLLALLGLYALALLALAAGYAVAIVVFDARRSWWPAEVQAYSRERMSKPRDRRTESMLLIAMGVAIGVAVLLAFR